MYSLENPEIAECYVVTNYCPRFTHNNKISSPGGLFVLSVSSFYLDNSEQTTANPVIVYSDHRFHDISTLQHFSK